MTQPHQPSHPSAGEIALLKAAGNKKGDPHQPGQQSPGETALIKAMSSHVNEQRDHEARAHKNELRPTDVPVVTLNLIGKGAGNFPGPGTLIALGTGIIATAVDTAGAAIHGDSAGDIASTAGLGLANTGINAIPGPVGMGLSLVGVEMPHDPPMQRTLCTLLPGMTSPNFTATMESAGILHCGDHMADVPQGLAVAQNGAPSAAPVAAPLSPSQPFGSHH